MSGPFKMKGSSFYGHGNSSPAKIGEEKDELVTHTDPNKPADYGGSDTSQYETKISKATQNLIDAGAPESEIEKSKEKTIEAFKRRNKNKQKNI